MHGHCRKVAHFKLITWQVWTIRWHRDNDSQERTDCVVAESSIFFIDCGMLGSLSHYNLMVDSFSILLLESRANGRGHRYFSPGLVKDSQVYQSPLMSGYSNNGDLTINIGILPTHRQNSTIALVTRSNAPYSRHGNFLS